MARQCSIHEGTWMMLVNRVESVGTDLATLRDELAEQLAWGTASRSIEAAITFVSRDESEHT